MRDVLLYIGVSLDGYIADENGGVDWLKGQDEHGNMYYENLNYQFGT